MRKNKFAIVEEIDLSIAELGAIVYAMQSVYGSGSDEEYISERIKSDVFSHFNRLGCPDFYDNWIEEFDLVD